jgi:hypothetical protein
VAGDELTDTLHVTLEDAIAQAEAEFGVSCRLSGFSESKCRSGSVGGGEQD